MPRTLEDLIEALPERLSDHAPITVELPLPQRQSEAVSQLRSLIRVARSGFPWEKTTKGDVASIYTNCETAKAPDPR